MPRAAIDIGSNSILLTIADGDTVIHDEARIVGLGTGLGDRGLFAPDRIAAASGVLADYVEIARSHEIEPHAIKAVATSAARRAMNAETFFERVLKRQGLRVRIISGDEEARLTWLGGQRALELPSGPILVVDLGGGSTELILGQSRQLEQRISLELGSVRLTEHTLEHDPSGRVDPRSLPPTLKHIAGELERFELEARPWGVVGIGGTVTTLAAMRLGLERYDSARVHGGRLDRAHLSGFIDQLLPTDRAERRALVAVAPDRADYLLAGALILDRVLAMSGCEVLVVSDRGLRYGLLFPKP